MRYEVIRKKLTNNQNEIVLIDLETKKPVLTTGSPKGLVGLMEEEGIHISEVEKGGLIIAKFWDGLSKPAYDEFVKESAEEVERLGIELLIHLRERLSNPDVKVATYLDRIQLGIKIEDEFQYSVCIWSRVDIEAVIKGVFYYNPKIQTPNYTLYNEPVSIAFLKLMGIVPDVLVKLEELAEAVYNHELISK